MHSGKSNPKRKASALAASERRFGFDAIGTRWSIDIYEPLSARMANKLLATVRERIEEFDAVYSRFRPDSLVTAMARSAGEYTLPKDAEPLLAVYRQLYDLTGGALTPLVGQLLADAGYDERYSLQAKPTLHKPPKWDETLAYRPPQLTVLRPVLLDVGAAGKGYLADIVAGMLASAGLRAFCVDAGGDIVYRTHAKIYMDIGLEHPTVQGQVVGVAHIANQSLCGSAGSRRAWGSFHHIINPHTLKSPHGIRATWVVADTALLADGLATALFLVPPAKLTPHFAFEFAVVHDDYRLEHSPGFPAEFFTGEEPRA
jgi:FAD:protein FMN transferase